MASAMTSCDNPAAFAGAIDRRIEFLSVSPELERMEDTGRGAVAPKHHLVIAGTGRAGTSFLVRYLTECGLETEISRNGDATNWNESAHAGFETFPLVQGDLPYVIKQPWLHEFAEQFFDRDDVRIDAAVIPIRDLMKPPEAE
jgi:hypothetical protein